MQILLLQVNMIVLIQGQLQCYFVCSIRHPLPNNYIIQLLWRFKPTQWWWWCKLRCPCCLSGPSQAIITGLYTPRFLAKYTPLLVHEAPYVSPKCMGSTTEVYRCSSSERSTYGRLPKAAITVTTSSCFLPYASDLCGFKHKDKLDFY